MNQLLPTADPLDTYFDRLYAALPAHQQTTYVAERLSIHIRSTVDGHVIRIEFARRRGLIEMWEGEAFEDVLQECVASFQAPF